MIILLLVLCGFLYLFGENKALEIVWLASQENMLEKNLIALHFKMLAV